MQAGLAAGKVGHHAAVIGSAGGSLSPMAEWQLALTG